MTKKLSSWEVSHREAEHRQTIRLRADLRSADRDAQIKTRARERATAVREREREQARRAPRRNADADAADAAKESQVRAWEEEVATYDAYVTALSSFHKTSSRIADAESAFQERMERRLYQRGKFTPRTFGDLAPRDEYLPAEFSPHSFDQSEFKRKLDRTTQSWTYVIVALVIASMVPWWRGAGYPSDLVTLAKLGGLIVGGSLLGVFIAAYFSGRHYGRLYRCDEARRKDDFDASEAARKTRLAMELASSQKLFTANRAAFEAREERRATEFEEQEDRNEGAFDRNEVERIDVLTEARAGGSDEIGLILEALLPLALPLIYPDDVAGRIDDHEVGYVVFSPRALQLAIQLPDLSVVPHTWIEMTPARTKMKRGDWTENNRNKTYRDLIASFCLTHVASVVLAYPFLDSVLIEATRSVTDPATGQVVDELVFQIDFSKHGIAAVDLAAIDAVESLKVFDGAFHVPGKKSNAPLASRIDRARLIWATDKDEGFTIPFGLVPSQTMLEIENPFA